VDDMTATETTTRDLTFYFDPLCPWSWRTSQWIRQVQQVRPLNVEWKFFSLAEVNGRDPMGNTPLRVEALARRQGGNEAVNRLYLALGKAIHDEHASMRDEDSIRRVVTGALQAAGFDAGLLQQALDDPTTLEQVLAEHAEARDTYAAFGVPWLVLEGQQIGFYGPVVDDMPQGPAADELWSHMEWILKQPYLYEIKRER